MRRLRWSIAKRVARLDGRPRRLTRLGASWELDPKEGIELRLIAGQPFEAAQRARFEAMIEACAPTRLLDIGANFGLYSVTLALARSDLAVEAFEPVSRTRARLLRNLALNGLDRRVRVHDLALSDAPGEAEIAIDPRSSGLSTLSIAPEELSRRDYATTETVRTARLDDEMELAGETLAIKIDVEGHELATLAGMTRILAGARGAMMVETRPRNEAQALALLTEAGWRETGRIREEIFLEKA